MSPNQQNTAVKFSIAALASGFFLSPVSSYAALTIYSDRAAFTSAHPGLVTEDFETVASIDDVLASIGIVPCLSFRMTQTGDEAYLAPAGQSSNPTRALGVDSPPSAGWIISFLDTTNVMGFDIFQNLGSGDQSGVDRTAFVEVFGTSGLLDTFNVTVQSGVGGFFGVFSDTDPISYVIVNDPGSYDVIDNVSFASDGLCGVSAIPEPSSFVALGIMLGSGMMFRRRQ